MKPKQEELPRMTESPKQSEKYIRLRELTEELYKILATFDIPARSRVIIPTELNGDKITITFQVEDSRV